MHTGRMWIDKPCVLGLGSGEHAVLQEVKRDAECCQTELFVQPQLLEPEEIFVDILGEVSADELLASVIEGVRAVFASVC